MSNKRIFNMIRKLNKSSMNYIRICYLQLDGADQIYSNKPLSDFIDFLETRLVSTDDDFLPIQNAVLSLNSLTRILDEFDRLDELTQFRASFIDSYLDEVYDNYHQIIVDKFQFNKEYRFRPFIKNN